MDERRRDKDIFSRCGRLTVPRADKAVPALCNFQNSRINGTVKRRYGIHIPGSNFKNRIALARVRFADLLDFGKFLHNSGIEISLFGGSAAVAARRRRLLSRQNFDELIDQNALIVGRRVTYARMPAENPQRR